MYERPIGSDPLSLADSAALPKDRQRPRLESFDVVIMLKEKNVKKKELGDKEFETMKKAHFEAAEQKAPFGESASKARFSGIPSWGSGSKV